MSRGREINILQIGMVCTVLVAVLLALSFVALGVGSAGYSPSQIVQALLHDESGPVRVVVYNLRLPRLIMAIEVGACLAVAGALLQAVMRNPLADPGIIGVSAGAATAATTILLLYPTLVSSVPLFAFGGAALSCVLIYLLAWRDGIDTVRIILSGVAINTVLGAYNSFLQLLNSDNLSSVLSFMNGSLSGRSWGPCLYHHRLCVYRLGAGDLLYKKRQYFTAWRRNGSQFRRRCCFCAHFSIGGSCIFSGGNSSGSGDDRLCRTGCAPYRANDGRVGLQGFAAGEYAFGRSDTFSG